MKNKITIIGSGSFATAIALVLHNSKNENIIIYGINKKELADLKKGKNSQHFPDYVKLPKFITTNNLQFALENSDYVFLAVPSKIIDVIFEQILKFLKKKIIIINCAKGFYPHSNLLIHSGLKEAAKNYQYVAGIVTITGPSHAEEVVLKYPTLVNIVGEDMVINRKVHKLFKTNYFKTYIQKDVIGIEVGAAYKNIIAIASGISSGLGYGINSQAAIISNGLAEMSKFNKLMNGNYETIYGLGSLGDLIATATSELSRNFQYGKSLAKSFQNKNTKITIEGLTALKYVYKIGQKHKLDFPIAYTLYNIIFKNQKIKDEIKKIWFFNELSE